MSAGVSTGGGAPAAGACGAGCGCPPHATVIRANIVSPTESTNTRADRVIDNPSGYIPDTLNLFTLFFGV